MKASTRQINPSQGQSAFEAHHSKRGSQEKASEVKRREVDAGYVLVYGYRLDGSWVTEEDLK